MSQLNADEEEDEVFLNSEKVVQPASLAENSEMFGNGYLSGVVALLSLG